MIGVREMFSYCKGCIKIYKYVDLSGRQSFAKSFVSIYRISNDLDDGLQGMKRAVIQLEFSQVRRRQAGGAVQSSIQLKGLFRAAVRK